MNFKTFRNKDTGVEAQYPAHYENHPIFGELLELVDPAAEEELEEDELEEDKVVVDDSHQLPVEQRTAKRTRKAATTTQDKE